MSVLPLLVAPRYFLHTAMVGIHDLLGRVKWVRALLDSGAQTTLISSEALSGMIFPRIFQEIPVRVSGITPGEDYVSNEDAILRLTSKFYPETEVDIQATVIPPVKWEYMSPHPVAQWLYNYEHCLADPQVIIDSGKVLTFEMILNVGCAIQLMNPSPILTIGNFEMRGGYFGFTLAGENPPRDSKIPILKDENQLLQSRVGAVLKTSPKALKVSKSAKTRLSLSDQLYGLDETLTSQDLELNAEIFNMLELLKFMYFGTETSEEELEQDVVDLESNFQQSKDGRLWVLLPKNSRCQLPLSKNIKLNHARVNKTKLRCDRDINFLKGYSESFETWKQIGVEY